MSELRFQATRVSEEHARKRRRSDRRPTRANAVGWVLVGLAGLYVLGFGKLTGRVDIVSPASGFTTLEDQIPVTVKALDSGAGTVTIDVNGTPQTLPAPGELFDVQVSLAPGENIISASADGVSSSPIKVVRKLRPVVRIDSPSGNTAVTENQIEVRGIIDNLGGRAVTIEVNGSAKSAVVAGERFSATLPLEIGRNIIRAQVPDALVPAEVVVSLETYIAITYPPDRTTLEQETVNVTGSVNNSTATAITLNLNEHAQTIPVRNGVFASNVVLRVGENRIQAFAGGKSSNELVVTRTLPPVVINLTSPQSGATQDPSASVRGTIQNARGNNISVRVNGVERVVPVKGAGFASEAPLKIGENRIRVSQGDASMEVMINRKPPPVVIQIRSPQNGVATEDSSIKVFGTIANPRGETVTLTVNGSSRPLPISRGTFASAEQLAIGENRIRVSQGDASMEVMINRKLLPVVIQIRSPQNGLATQESSIKVVGTIANSQGETVTLTVNGSSRPLSISRGTFASAEQLAVGENRIRVSQGDASMEVMVHRKQPTVVIRISSPQSGRTTDSAVTLTGEVENAQEKAVTITVNGIFLRRVPLTNGSFNSVVELNPGRNLITASVKGASDQITLVRPKIIIDPPKARIIIDSPRNGELTRQRVLVVNGRIENVEAETVTLTVNGKALQVQTAAGMFRSKVTLSQGKNSIKASFGDIYDEVTVTQQMQDVPPDKPRDEPADRCSKINCDCKNLKTTLSNTGAAAASSEVINSQLSPFSISSSGSSQRPAQDRQAQCREAESSLKKNCEATGQAEGYCPPNASGPNAWPKPKGKRATGVRVFKKVFTKEKQEGVKKP